MYIEVHTNQHFLIYFKFKDQCFPIIDVVSCTPIETLEKVLYPAGLCVLPYQKRK